LHWRLVPCKEHAADAAIIQTSAEPPADSQSIVKHKRIFVVSDSMLTADDSQGVGKQGSLSVFLIPSSDHIFRPKPL
jgi:hypothetical protein